MTFEYEQFFFNNIVCQSQLDKPLTTLGMIPYISLPVSRALLYRGGENMNDTPPATMDPCSPLHWRRVHGDNFYGAV